jgi:Spy/CpxP family protein refolding chaperone
MKRLTFLLLFGVSAGVLAHILWFAARRPVEVTSIEAQLAWMKTELKLSDSQFARVKEIHRTSSPELLALSDQVSRMQREFQTFERERTSSGNVDFLAFAQFIDARRSIDMMCHEKTKRLVASTAEILTPEQKQRYLSILGPRFNSALQ